MKLSSRDRNINTWKVVVFALTFVIAYGIIIFSIPSQGVAYSLKLGQVSTVDILAPTESNFISEYRTEQERIAAEKEVNNLYYPVDPGIARRQIEKLRGAITFISVIREDQYSNLSEKIEDIGLLSDIKPNNEIADKILQVSLIQWQNLQEEALNVLEQAMRDYIREDNLHEIIRSIPSLIRFTFSQEQANIIVALVSPFVVPNSLFNEEATLAAKQEARNSVNPVIRTVAAGEAIVRRGQIITATTMEDLNHYNLVAPVDQTRIYVTVFFLVSLITIVTALYLGSSQHHQRMVLREIILISLVFLLFLVGARLIIPNRVVIPYLFPIAAFGLVISSLFTIEFGLISSLALIFLISYNLPNSAVLTIYYLLPGICGLLILGNGRRILHFLWSGLFIGLCGTAVIIAFRFTDATLDTLGLFTLIGASFFNGIASASLALLLQYLSAHLLGMITPLQLLELSRPDHPMMQFLLQNAPGTYQHSLQVANLAERAADQIKADALLCRVGAFYHDVGKAANPQYFIENQLPGKRNPHEDLDPYTSATVIIKHVSDGSRLAKKYKLPPRIHDFIVEHHGTLLARYQYSRAIEERKSDTDEVDIEQFRYPGPKPGSKETAILMLADGCEARARADYPKNQEELTKLVEEVVAFYEKEGQFSTTSLTLSDLTIISSSFVNTLKNMYHPRIQYPEAKQQNDPSIFKN